MSLFFSLRSLLNRLHDDLVKIGSSVETTAAEYKAENAKDKPAPVITSVLHRPQAEIDNEEAREARQEGRDNVRLTVEVIGLGVAGILAVATIGLWLVTRESTRIAGIAADAAQRSAKASELQVMATQESIHATVHAFQLDQRAWVSPVAIIQPEFKETKPFSITTEIGNSGKTPALNFSNKYSWNIILKTGKFQPVYQHVEGVPSSGTIFPNQQLELISIPTPLEHFDLVISGRAVFYVYGELIYDDVFKQTHHTHFCVFYNETLKPGVCSTYNDAD
jgi:hypothetical protein